ncbi:MAG: Asp23/Gls24 family envelope stress response protein [Anaerolineales bacterium]
MRNPDSTTVSPEVLREIARLTALKVPGVHAASPRRHGIGAGADEGVRVQIEDGLVDVDLYLVMDAAVNLRQVSREVQAAVARAISEMLGMIAGRINIHIDDVYFPTAG